LAFGDTVLLAVAQIFAEEFGDNFYQIGDGVWAFTDYATICPTAKPKTVLARRWFPLTSEEQNDYAFKLLGQEVQQGHSVYPHLFPTEGQGPPGPGPCRKIPRKVVSL
jgi:hypothetical protein